MNHDESILITGSGGMLAQAMHLALTARGLTAILVTRAECDVSSAESVRRIFERHRPTLLINCAAYTKVDLAEEQTDQADAVNGTALEILSLQAKIHGTRVVHYSTDFVFDGSATRPYRTTDPTNPLSAYGRSKRLGEQLLQDVDPPNWMIIRTAWLYGPGGPCFPRTMLTLARKGVPLRVVSDQIGSPTLTTDLAQATLNLLDRGATGIWHVCNSGKSTWFDFTREILMTFGVDGVELTPTTAAEWKQTRPKSAVRPAYSVLDAEPYEQFVDESIPHWRDALSRYAAETGASN